MYDFGGILSWAPNENDLLFQVLHLLLTLFKHLVPLFTQWYGCIKLIDCITDLGSTEIFWVLKTNCTVIIKYSFIYPCL